MSKEKKKIGYNPANINPIEDQAIKLIKEVYENLLDLKQHIKKSWLGKNKTLRDNGAVMSNIMSNKLIKRLESWHKVIDAKDNGVHIHSAPMKHHKLEIVKDASSDFGQYLADKDDTPKKPVQLELPFEEFKNEKNQSRIHYKGSAGYN